MKAQFVVGSVVSCLALASTGCSIDIPGDRFSVFEERQFTLVDSEPVEVNLRTFDGTIRVLAWNRPEIQLQIERRADDASTAEALAVNVSQDGNRVEVDAPSPDRQGGVVRLGPGPSVNLTVMTPRHLSLEARTGDGGIEVDDLSGTIALNSGDGGVTASRVEGVLTARTGDGSMRIDEVDGTVEADSGDGSIRVQGRLTGLSVRTGDGSVQVEAADGSAVETDWHITTGDGRIRLRVPESFDAELDAFTGEGAVRIIGISEPADRDRSQRSAWTGRLGEGGQRVRLRSGDGSIEVARR